MNTQKVQLLQKGAERRKSASYLESLLFCRCPRCRQGNMFAVANPWQLKTTMKMNDTCPACTQPMNIEVGFYYGAGYISYALCVAFSVATFLIWWMTIGLSIHDNRLYYWLTINSVLLVLMQPYLMRLSRSLWLSVFVKYNKNWETEAPEPPERTNEAHEGNW